MHCCHTLTSHQVDFLVTILSSEDYRQNILCRVSKTATPHEKCVAALPCEN